jgi:hypothetical protein
MKWNRSLIYLSMIQVPFMKSKKKFSISVDAVNWKRSTDRSEPQTVVPVTLTTTSAASVMSGISTSSILTFSLPCLSSR